MSAEKEDMPQDELPMDELPIDDDVSSRGRYDWTVESDASIVSDNGVQVALRVNCYFKNNNWDYYMYCTGWTSCSDGGMAHVFGRANLDTRPSGNNGRTFVGSWDYIIAKSRGGHNVRYSARIMSDGGYANGDKWSAEHSAWIPSLASYTISYNANGGSGAPGNQTRWYGQSDFYISNTRPTRTGYTFVRWDGSDGKQYSPGSHFGGDYNLTLTAVWRINTYTVTFKDGYSGTTLKTQNVNYGGSATPPSASRTGYTHTGWDGSYTNITSNRTINATWRINQYNLDVNFNVDGTQYNNYEQMKQYGTFDMYINGSLVSNDVSDYSTDHNYNTSYSVKDIRAKTGYTYTGSSGAPLSGNLPARDIGVVVHFKTNKYTVSFNQNTSDPVTGMPNSMTKTHFVSIKLPTNVPERRRYEFLGWATSAGGNVVYHPGDTYSAEGNATLYAVWKLKASIITVYSESGERQSGLCHIYDSNGELHYAILYVYDSNGNVHEVI